MSKDTREHKIALRLPEDVAMRFDKALQGFYSPYKPPSRNQMIVQAVRELTERMEQEIQKKEAPRQ